MEVLMVQLKLNSDEEYELYRRLAKELGIDQHMVRPVSSEEGLLRGEIDDGMYSGLIRGGFHESQIEVISRSKDPRNYIAKENTYLDRLEEHYGNRNRLRNVKRKGD